MNKPDKIKNEIERLKFGLKDHWQEDYTEDLEKIIKLHEELLEYYGLQEIFKDLGAGPATAF